MKQSLLLAICLGLSCVGCGTAPDATDLDDLASKARTSFNGQLGTADGRSYWIEVTLYEVGIIPSQSHAIVGARANGHLVGSSTRISTGWRVEPVAAAIVTKRPAFGDLLVVDSARVMTGEMAVRQYYSIVGDRCVLLRIEDPEGHVIRNLYYAPNLSFGPSLPARTADDWEKMLRSENLAEVLAALEWLSGVHLKVSAIEKLEAQNILHENPDHAKLHGTVLSRPGVQQILRELASSANPWISEAAALARDPLDSASVIF